MQLSAMSFKASIYYILLEIYRRSFPFRQRTVCFNVTTCLVGHQTPQSLF